MFCAPANVPVGRSTGSAMPPLRTGRWRHTARSASARAPSKRSTPSSRPLPPLNRFFVEAERQEDDALLAKLAAADAARDDVGVIHADNAKAQRGGFSLYVPEYYAADREHPLIVALHGGSGHGRDFLWTWLVEARTRGAILLSPDIEGSNMVADGARRGTPPTCTR